MLIAHGGVIGTALEFALILVPVLVFLKLRRKFKPHIVGAPPTTKTDKEAPGDQTGAP